MGPNSVQYVALLLVHEIFLGRARLQVAACSLACHWDIPRVELLV